MMRKRHPLQPMIDQLVKLPGIGPKSAQRLAFFLLSLPHSAVQTFAHDIVSTHKAIRFCECCFNISLEPVCAICSDSARDSRLLCVVAQPKDLLAIEKTREFLGHYHVLGGLISPLDGVHPESLRIRELVEKLKSTPVSEVILALNPTVEGDATALYLAQYLAPLGVSLTQLAYGLPMGADIDYADELTLQKSFLGRTRF